MMIIFKRMSIIESGIAGCYVLFSLLILSIFSWIIINGFRIVPLFMVAIYLAAFVGGLGIALFLISSFGNLRGKSVDLIKCNQKRFRNAKPESWKGYMMRVWAAQHPLPINCGHQFAFSKDALMNYLTVMCDMITNSLLLIKV